MLLFHEVISLIENSNGLNPIPTRTTSPFGLNISIDCFSAIFAPEHSITRPRLSLPHISWQRFTTSSLEAFTTSVAPNSFAMSNLTFASSSSPTTTILTAPIILAICTENNPRGPVPNTTTSCPGKNFDCWAIDLYALQIGSNTAASSYLRFSGISHIACLCIFKISPGIKQYFENPPPHLLLSKPRFTFSVQHRKSPCSQAGHTPHT